MHQRQHAIQTKSNFSSDDSDTDTSNSFGVHNQFKGKLIESMLSYQTKTLTDRQLLLGLLDKDISDKVTTKPEDKTKLTFTNTKSAMHVSSQKLNQGTRLGATTQREAFENADDLSLESIQASGKISND